MSEITVIGNVAKPELRFTQAGKPVFGFSLAQSHRKKDQSGQWQDDGTTWRKVTVWDQKGELLAEHISQGDRVMVVGQERIREYDKQDGSKGQSLELNARDVGIVPKMNNSNNSGGYQQQSSGQHEWGAEHQQSQPAADPWSASNNQAAPF